MRKNKMTHEDSFCITCAGVQQSDQSAPIDRPKLRSSSEIEKCEYLFSISCQRYAQYHSIMYEAISSLNTGNDSSDKLFDSLKEF